MLEMLVQDEPLRARYVMIPARIPKPIKIEKIKSEKLPADWRDMGAREQLQIIGGGWAKRQACAVLAVPSASIPAEMNYLLNPLHLDFKKIVIGKPEHFITDLRLISANIERKKTAG